MVGGGCDGGESGLGFWEVGATRQFYNLWPDLSPGAFCIMLMMVGTGNGNSANNGHKLQMAMMRNGSGNGNGAPSCLDAFVQIPSKR